MAALRNDAPCVIENIQDGTTVLQSGMSKTLGSHLDSLSDAGLGGESWANELWVRSPANVEKNIKGVPADSFIQNITVLSLRQSACMLARGPARLDESKHSKGNLVEKG